MITAVTCSSASVHHRRAVIPSDACTAATSELAVGSASPRQPNTFAQTPAQRHVAARAPRWPRSDQPWRAFQRGFRLLRTNTLRPRRTTTDPAFCFNALSEFLAFIVRRPFGPSSLLLQVVEGSTIFLRPKFRPDRDPCDQSRRGELERCSGLTPGEMRGLLDVDRSLADTCLGMLCYGLVQRVGRGKYVAAEPASDDRL